MTTLNLSALQQTSLKYAFSREMVCRRSCLIFCRAKSGDSGCNKNIGKKGWRKLHLIVGAQSGGGAGADLLTVAVTQGLPDAMVAKWGLASGNSLDKFNAVDNLTLGKVNAIGSEYLAANLGMQSQYQEALGAGTQVLAIAGDQALAYKDVVAYLGGKQFGTTVFLDQTYTGQTDYTPGSVLSWYHRLEGAFASWNQSNGDLNTLSLYSCH